MAYDQKLADAEREIERLWVALESYAVHHGNCYGEKTCTCGLKKLLAERKHN